MIISKLWVWILCAALLLPATAAWANDSGASPAGTPGDPNGGAFGGVANAVGKTFGAVYGPVFAADENVSPVVPVAARESKPRARSCHRLKYRYWPRFQGRVARWTVSVKDD